MNKAAPPRVRTLYMLKKLTGAPQWIGRHVHEAIRTVIHAIRCRQPLPEPDHAVDAMLRKMRQEFKDSRDFRYRENPNRFVGLREHEHELKVEDEKWKAYADHAVDCVRAFYRLAVFDRLAKLPPDAILTVDDKVEIQLGRLPVIVRFDLAYRDTNDLVICDWKTGLGTSPHPDLQAACYALCAHIRWHAPPETIKMQTIQLPTGQTQLYPVSPDSLEETRSFIEESADEMLFPLADPDRDIPEDEEAFDLAEDSKVCEHCNFLKACPVLENLLKEHTP